MNVDLEKGTITIYGKAIKIDALVKKISTFSGQQLSGFLDSRNIKLARTMNIAALRTALNDKIKFLHSKSLSYDEFSHLEYIDSFTEYNMEKLYDVLAFDDKETFEKYRYALAMIIVYNYEALELTDGEINYIKTIGKQKMESYKEYINYISVACAERENEFDGVSLDKLKTDMVKIEKEEDILANLAKYGIELSDRLTKEEYLEYIEYSLSVNGIEYDEDELSAKSLAELSTFARRNNIEMQPSMDKQMLVDYMIYYLSGCEILKTSIENFIIPDEVKPLEFKVDMESLSRFNDEDSEAVKVISYEGDEADKEKLDEILNDLNNIPTKFIDLEESPEIKAPLLPGSVTESAPYVDENDEEEEIEPAELNDAEIQSMIDAELNKNKKEEDPVKIRFNNFTKNEEYGSKRLKNLGKVPAGRIWAIVLTCVGLALIGFAIYGIVRVI